MFLKYFKIYFFLFFFLQFKLFKIFINFKMKSKKSFKMKSKKSFKKSFKSKKNKKNNKFSLLNKNKIKKGGDETYVVPDHQQQSVPLYSPIVSSNGSQNIAKNSFFYLEPVPVQTNELPENSQGFIMPTHPNIFNLQNKSNESNESNKSSLYEIVNSNTNTYNTFSSSKKIFTVEQFNNLMKYIKDIFSTKIDENIIDLFNLLIESKTLEDLIQKLQTLSNNNKSSNSFKIEIDSKNAYFTLDEFLNILQKIKDEFEKILKQRKSTNNIFENNLQKISLYKKVFDNYTKNLSFFLFLLEKYILKLKENIQSFNNENNRNKPFIKILEWIQKYKFENKKSINNEITNDKFFEILRLNNIGTLLNETQLEQFKDICKIFGININKIKSGGSNPSNGYANSSNGYANPSNGYNLGNGSNNELYNTPQQRIKPINNSFQEEYNNVQFSNHFNRNKLPNYLLLNF
jgi:hypothetical protein